MQNLKLISLFFLFFLVISGCGKSESEKHSKNRNERLDRAKGELLGYEEKILLLSEIKSIPYDSLTHILTDYYVITTDYSYSTDSLKFYSEKAINDISTKYQIPKKRVATLIFCFKYEMLSKDEIINHEIEKQEEEQQEPPEDPR